MLVASRILTDAKVGRKLTEQGLVSKHRCVCSRGTRRSRIIYASPSNINHKQKPFGWYLRAYKQTICEALVALLSFPRSLYKGRHQTSDLYHRSHVLFLLKGKSTYPQRLGASFTNLPSMEVAPRRPLLMGLHSHLAFYYRYCIGLP
jgi:hypothetical protein